MNTPINPDSPLTILDLLIIFAILGLFIYYAYRREQNDIEADKWRIYLNGKEKQKNSVFQFIAFFFRATLKKIKKG